MRELIAPTTDAVTKSIQVPNDKFVSVAHNGLTGAEEITFNIKMADVPTPVAPKVALTATTNLVQIAGPMTYEVVKPTTVAAVGVYVEL